MSYFIVFLAGFFLATLIFQNTLRKWLFMFVIKSLLWIDKKISDLDKRKSKPKDDFEET